MSKKAPYGTWDSLVTSDIVVSKDNIVFDDVLVDPIKHTVYHLEESPKDGRCIIVHTETNQEVLPTKYSARSLVQEYGGAPAIVYDDTIYFSNQYDYRIYAFKVGDTDAKAVTPEDPKKLLRYANFAIHPQKTNLLVTLREDHSKDDDPQNPHPENVVNTICVVDTLATTVNILVQGADFYATPVLNLSGDMIAWQEWALPTAPWNLPGMPWESGIIYVAQVVVESETLKLTSTPVLVAGEVGKKSATFPIWITDTTLAYTTDGYNKFQNPYIFHTDTNNSTPVLEEPLAQDFAEPAWFLGLYPYAILDEGKYGVFTAFENGRNVLYIIDLAKPSVPVPVKNFDFAVAQHVRPAGADLKSFVFTGSKSTEPGGVILGTVSGSSGSYTVEFKVLKSSGEVPAKLKDYISPPVPLTLRDTSNPLYVVYYAPKNPEYSGSSDPQEKPPCIVGVHGGPTGLEPQALNWIKMFYTSRGFAWLDVNYRGSSGYGREYIDLLNGKWGIYDVEDSKEAATILAEEYSYIDGKRVAVRGGSAGAYTTLSSVTFAPNPTYYKSACGAYGCVADVQHLTEVTEKFEMRYIYTLFGSAPTGGAWDSRNPIKHASNINVPLLILQGLVDGVVPPDIVRDFLRQSSQSAPSGQFAFYPNEGHHWHLEYTIKNALAREYRWYLDTLL